MQDGDTLYVDRNGNGDLTEDGKRVKLKQQGDSYRSFEAGDLTIGGLTHSGPSVSQMKASPELVGNDQEWERIKKSGPEPWTWWLRFTAERTVDDKRDLPRKLGYVINGDGAGMLLFADKPQDAPIIHLNSPFTLGLQDRKQRLIAGNKTMLQIGVGPQGVGPGTFAFALYPNTIPNDAYPEAEITFPRKSAGAGADQTQIHAQGALLRQLPGGPGSGPRECGQRHGQGGSRVRRLETQRAVQAQPRSKCRSTSSKRPNRHSSKRR